MERVEDDFQYTEFSLDWREKTPQALLGSAKLLWGCVAFMVAFASRVYRRP